MEEDSNEFNDTFEVGEARGLVALSTPIEDVDHADPILALEDGDSFEALTFEYECREAPFFGLVPNAEDDDFFARRHQEYKQRLQAFNVASPAAGAVVMGAAEAVVVPGTVSREEEEEVPLVSPPERHPENDVALVAKELAALGSGAPGVEHVTGAGGRGGPGRQHRSLDGAPEAEVSAAAGGARASLQDDSAESVGDGSEAENKAVSVGGKAQPIGRGRGASGPRKVLGEANRVGYVTLPRHLHQAPPLPLALGGTLARKKCTVPVSPNLHTKKRAQERQHGGESAAPPAHAPRPAPSKPQPWR